MPSNGPSSGAIDRAAGPFVAASAVPAAVAALTGHRRSALSLLALPAGVAAFFRDPDRTPDHRQVDPDLVLAPADGRVMYAGPAQDEVAPPGQWQQVSIFLSLFDVHINRTPYGGTVDDVTYRPGTLARGVPLRERHRERAQRDHASDTVDGEDRRVVFRQIVGLVARRVVTRVQKGDVVRTGQRIGLMKFGSRMDVFVPPHVDLGTAVGDRTVAGETVIARWPSAATSRAASLS